MVMQSKLPPQTMVVSPVPSLVPEGLIDETTAPRGSGHCHWTVQCVMVFDPRADDAAGNPGRMYDVATITVEAEDESGALASAKRRLPGRAGYRVTSVAETCTLDPALSR